MYAKDARKVHELPYIRYKFSTFLLIVEVVKKMQYLRL